PGKDDALRRVCTYSQPAFSMNTTLPSPPPKVHLPRWRRIWTRLMADRGPGKKRLWALIAIPTGILALAGCIALLILYAVLTKGLPSIDWARHYRPPIVTNVVSGDQQVMGEFYDERRVVVAYERVPKKLVQAFIASEDADFFDHGGVSLTGLLRGLYQTYVKRTRIVGGSTLSQQTAKAIIASAEGAKAVRIRSGWPGVRRKLREFILTRRLETNFKKETIIILYLNEVYPVQDIFRETAPYVTEHVRRDVVARYGNQRLLQDGLQIFTTVDLEREHDAIAATLKGILEVDKRQGFRGALMRLPEKDWADFAQKEEKFLQGDGKNENVVAALV